MPGSGFTEPAVAESKTRPISTPAAASVSGSEQSQFETTATPTPARSRPCEQRGDVGVDPKRDRVDQECRRPGRVGGDAELVEHDRGAARAQLGQGDRVGALVAVVGVVGHLRAKGPFRGGRRHLGAQVPAQRPAQPQVRLVDVDQRPERIQEHGVVAGHGMRSVGCSRRASSSTSVTARGPVSVSAGPSTSAKRRSRTAGSARVALLRRSPASVTPRPATAR